MSVKIRRRTVWTIAVAVVATVLVILLILIAAGALVVPGAAPPSPVTVTSVQYTILQGTNASGNGWFGPNVVTYSGPANGFPVKLSPGAQFTEWFTIINFDSSPHTVYSVAVQAPFTFVQSSPGLPQTLKALQDDADLEIFLTAPSTAGATGTLFITIDALPPS
jgi:hypothetical protein